MEEVTAVIQLVMTERLLWEQTSVTSRVVILTLVETETVVVSAAASLFP